MFHMELLHIDLYCFVYFCLTEPRLGEIVSVLKEITEPYQLGIYLDIETHELDKFEKNFPRNVDRQTIEVIKQWQHNNMDCSWEVLANAVEKMGGHADLVRRLRDMHL